MEQRLIDANKLNFDKLYQYFETDNDYDYACCKVEDADTVLTIPENPTNGDMIKALFKPYNIVIHEYHIHIYLTENDWLNGGDWISFGRDWWNAPYRESGAEMSGGGEYA